MTLPPELFNRTGDNWRGLFSIAEAAGGEWPERAKQAAMEEISEEDSNRSLQLLEAIWQIFAEKKVVRLHTKVLLDALKKIEEAPWEEANNGREIDGYWLREKLTGVSAAARKPRGGGGAPPLPGMAGGEWPPSRATRKTICAKPGGATSTERRRARQHKPAERAAAPRRAGLTRMDRECRTETEAAARNMHERLTKRRTCPNADENRAAVLQDRRRATRAHRSGARRRARAAAPARTRSGRHDPHGAGALVRSGALQGAPVLRHRRGDGGRPGRRDRRRCGGRPHRRRLRDHGAAERAGAPRGSRASRGRGEGEGAGLRRAPRRGATGQTARRSAAALTIAKAELAALQSAEDHAGRAGLDPQRSTVRLCSLYAGGGRVAVIDLHKVDWAVLAPIWERPIVMHNAAFDLGYLAKRGIEPVGVDCTLQAVRLLNGPNATSLETAAASYFGLALDKTLQTSDWGAKHLSLAQVDLRGGRRGRDLAARRDGPAAARRTPHGL